MSDQKKFPTSDFLKGKLNIDWTKWDQGYRGFPETIEISGTFLGCDGTVKHQTRIIKDGKVIDVIDIKKDVNASSSSLNTQ